MSGPACVGRRAPAHVQAGQAPRGRRHHRRGGRQRRLGRVENGDDVSVGDVGAEEVRRSHLHQVARLGLPVIPLADLRLDLTRAIIDGEIYRVHALKGVDQVVIVFVVDVVRLSRKADIRRRRDHSVAHRLREAPTPGVGARSEIGRLVEANDRNGKRSGLIPIGVLNSEGRVRRLGVGDD